MPRDYLKCEPCRKYRKKCKPSGRVWNSYRQDKCERCEQYDHCCGPPQKAERKLDRRHQRLVPTIATPPQLLTPEHQSEMNGSVTHSTPRLNYSVPICRQPRVSSNWWSEDGFTHDLALTVLLAAQPLFRKALCSLDQFRQPSDRHIIIPASQRRSQPGILATAVSKLLDKGGRWLVDEFKIVAENALSQAEQSLFSKLSVVGLKGLCDSVPVIDSLPPKLRDLLLCTANIYNSPGTRATTLLLPDKSQYEDLARHIRILVQNMPVGTWAENADAAGLFSSAFPAAHIAFLNSHHEAALDLHKRDLLYPDLDLDLCRRTLAHQAVAESNLGFVSRLATIDPYALQTRVEDVLDMSLLAIAIHRKDQDAFVVLISRKALVANGLEVLEFAFETRNEMVVQHCLDKKMIRPDNIVSSCKTAIDVGFGEGAKKFLPHLCREWCNESDLNNLIVAAEGRFPSLAQELSRVELPPATPQDAFNSLDGAGLFEFLNSSVQPDSAFGEHPGWD